MDEKISCKAPSQSRSTRQAGHAGKSRDTHTREWRNAPARVRPKTGRKTHKRGNRRAHAFKNRNEDDVRDYVHNHRDGDDHRFCFLSSDRIQERADRKIKKQRDERKNQHLEHRRRMTIRIARKKNRIRRDGPQSEHDRRREKREIPKSLVQQFRKLRAIPV